MILPALAFAFAAFCVWITVRIVNRCERWAKRTLAAAVALPVLYVASFGPVAWISFQAEVGHQTIEFVYRPLCILAAKNEKFRCGLSWYIRIGPIQPWAPIFDTSGFGWVRPQDEDN